MTPDKKQKVEDLLAFFDTVEVKPGEVVKISQAETIVDVEKFINFSRDLLAGRSNFTKITYPYLARLHKLRLYYEQKRRNKTS